MNPLEYCTISCTLYLWLSCVLFFFLLFFSSQKWTQVSQVSLGPSGWKLAASRRLRKKKKPQLQSNLLQVSLRKEAVLVLAHTQTQATNPAFFSRHVGSGSQWRTGEEKEEEGKRERGGEKQPQGWREILYACALKHKVCGQLLNFFLFFFFWESRLYTESIE